MGETKIPVLKCPPGEIVVTFPDAEPFCYHEDTEPFAPGGFGNNYTPCTRPERMPQVGKGLYCHTNTSIAYTCPTSDDIQDVIIDAYFPYNRRNSEAIDAKVDSILLQKEMRFAWSLLLRGCMGIEPLNPGLDDGGDMTLEFSISGAPVGFISQNKQSGTDNTGLEIDRICCGECVVLTNGSELLTTERVATLGGKRFSVSPPNFSDPRWPYERLHIVRSADGRKVDEEGGEDTKQKQVAIYKIKIEDSKTGESRDINLEMKLDEKPNLLLIYLDRDKNPELINRRNVAGPKGYGSYYYVLHSGSELERLQKAFAERVLKIHRAETAKKASPQSAERAFASQINCP